MFQNLKQVFAPTNKDLRKRILFTLGALALFIVGTFIRIPGTTQTSRMRWNTHSSMPMP